MDNVPGLSKYQSVLNKALERGDATEHTHRPTLKKLIESLGPDLTATNEPKQIKCGAPDYIVTRKSIPLGHIEAKDVGKDLAAIEKDSALKTPKTREGEQLKRYREALPNLILTDYLNFRLYVDGERRITAAVDPDTSNEPVQELLNAFLNPDVPTVRSPQNLAERMAAKARLARTIIHQVFDAESTHGTLHTQLDGFRKVLIETLSEDEFADMYAQTICYGLFAARCNHDPKKTFTRAGTVLMSRISQKRKNKKKLANPCCWPGAAQDRKS